MSSKANSIFTDPEIPSATPPELADTTSFEEVLQFIYGWPDHAKGAPQGDRANEEWRSRRRIRPSLSRALSGRIPFEVVELFMDRMSQGSLSSCVLVCKAWYQASIRLLYRDIAISSRVAFDSLAAFALNDSDPRAAERFAQTNALRVGGQQRDVPVHAVPLIFARLMPQVRRLVFHMSLHPLMHVSFFDMLPLFRAVTTLELFRFTLRCFSELRRIICAFPQLKHLKLCVGVFETDTGPVATVHPTRIRLEQLVLGWGLTPAVIVPLVRWLAESSACANLTHLAIWRNPFNVSLQVNELLEVAGRNLLSIHELDLDSDDGLEFLWPAIAQAARAGASAYSQHNVPLLAHSINTHCTFAYSPNLHTIRFELRACTLDEDPRDKWHTVALELQAMLMTVRSPALRSIKVHQAIQLTGKFFPLSAQPRLFYAKLESPALLSVHRAMQEPVFKNLDSVEFSFDMEYSAWDFFNSEGTVAIAAQRFSSGVSHLMGPWHRRGLVTTVQKRNPIYSKSRL